MKKLPIGISDFRKVIRDNNYFVDKSMFIHELINSNAQVSLMPRPRRFGKNLNLSMLQYFFEHGEDSSYLCLGIWLSLKLANLKHISTNILLYF